MQSLSIEAVEEAFNQWRQNRNTRTEAIPLNLWDMAIRLYPRYKQSQICQRLHLSGGQFKQKLKTGFNPGNIDGGFVTATSKASAIPHQVIREITLTLQGKDRVLSFRLSVLDLPKVLPYFETLL